MDETGLFPTEETAAWSTEDDSTLSTLVQTFGLNWGIIATCFNSTSSTPRKRAELEYRHHNPPPPLDPDPKIARRKLKSRLNSEREKRHQALLARFETIGKAAKKRDNVRLPLGIVLF